MSERKCEDCEQKKHSDDQFDENYYCDECMPFPHKPYFHKKEASKDGSGQKCPLYDEESNSCKTPDFCEDCPIVDLLELQKQNGNMNTTTKEYRMLFERNCTNCEFRSEKQPLNKHIHNPKCMCLNEKLLCWELDYEIAKMKVCPCCNGRGIVPKELKP